MGTHTKKAEVKTSYLGLMGDKNVVCASDESARPNKLNQHS